MCLDFGPPSVTSTIKSCRNPSPYFQNNTHFFTTFSLSYLPSPCLKDPCLLSLFGRFRDMGALYFLKFWRPTTAGGGVSSGTTTNTTHKDDQSCSGKYSDATRIPRGTTTAATVVYAENEFNEEEDSFFELELTVPDLDNNNNTSTNNSVDKDSNRFDLKEEAVHVLDNKAGEDHNHNRKFPQPTLSLSPTDLKRKILPIEPNSSPKPQSPISLLKSSAPRFQVLMFKKSKSVALHKAEGRTELDSVFVDTPNHHHSNNDKQESTKFFTIKFKLQPANGPVIARDNSLRRQMMTENQQSLSSDDCSSKRFSKELMQKYLKLINPLYIKVSKKQSEKKKSPGDFSVQSPSLSPATSSPRKEKQGSNVPSGFRVVSKHLGKSKSASAAATGVSSPVSRRDDSLLLQHDGIQSAILHCKKSFNSSRDSSLLSRFASDTSSEKSMYSPRNSSEDNGTN